MNHSDSDLDREATGSAVTAKPLVYRCLALTGSFETGKGIPDCFCGLSGDFDGQGMSFGVLQWNLGQKSLQPLLRTMQERHPDVMKTVFADQYDAVLRLLDSPQADTMQVARSIQHPHRHTILEPWRSMFVALGRTPEFQQIETESAAKEFESALGLCERFELWSERAAALMFDIRVQNGGITSKISRVILADFETIGESLSRNELEISKMLIVANRRADAASPRWREDVRARKLCCANGRGVVHGIEYNLENQFGIGLNRLESR